MRVAVLGTGPAGETMAAKLMADLGDAASGAEVVVKATNRAGSISGLEATGEENLAGEVLIDVANPLDFSQGLPPSLFVSGNDADAETRVSELLQSLGWTNVIDLGDITTARGTEMPLWLRVMGSTQNHMLNIEVVR